MSELFGSAEAFYEMFIAYNRAVWPMPVIMYMLGIAAVILMVNKAKWHDTIIAFILSFFWLWAGIVFFLMYFSKMKPIYYLVALIFVVQGVLFLLNGFGVGIKPRLSFQVRTDGYGWVGGLFILYAMVVYPLIGTATEHGYPGGPIFGTAPCPMTIFTVGMLLLTDKKVPVSMLIIPLFWALGGVVPVVVYGVFADIGLVIAGILGTLLIVRRNKA